MAVARVPTRSQAALSRTLGAAGSAARPLPHPWGQGHVGTRWRWLSPRPACAWAAGWPEGRQRPSVPASRDEVSPKAAAERLGHRGPAAICSRSDTAGTHGLCRDPPCPGVPSAGSGDRARPASVPCRSPGCWGHGDGSSPRCPHPCPCSPPVPVNSPRGQERHPAAAVAPTQPLPVPPGWGLRGQEPPSPDKGGKPRASPAGAGKEAGLNLRKRSPGTGAPSCHRPESVPVPSAGSSLGDPPRGALGLHPHPAWDPTAPMVPPAELLPPCQKTCAKSQEIHPPAGTALPLRAACWGRKQARENASNFPSPCAGGRVAPAVAVGSGPGGLWGRRSGARPRAAAGRGAARGRARAAALFCRTRP